MVNADLTPAEQVAFDQAAEALRLPSAGERASEAASGLRELSPGLPAPIEDRAAYGAAAARLDPPQAGRTPSRRDWSRRRRGLGATSEP